MQKSRHLITSAIPYVNGVKHLGNLIGSMLPADVYARFRRQQGHETLFICGTDDHGTPVEIAAAKEKTPVTEFVAHWHAFQENVYRNFGLSFDWFGSSSRPQNHALTQHFAQKLHESGLLDVKTEKMLYSKADGRFLPDRYVEGECPHCHYGKARGDQCENCGRVLDPTDLINPRSAISGSTELEVRETKHLHFRQSDPALLEKLTAWIESHTEWPLLSKSIALKWLAEGLQDRGITRDIQWGVPVPVETFGEEFRGKVFYVWFDAPIAYIAATRELTDSRGEPDSAWQSWWREDKGASNVTYTEFMGKDNVYFHTVSFPATLLGSNEPWKKVDSLKSFNWLTYYGGKFSTSQGIGIFTDTALELLPADLWRYYLLSRAPESDDSSFTWTDLQAVVNKDLADVLGNFVNRTLQLTHKHFGAQVPQAGEWTEAEHALAGRLQTLVERLTTHLENAEMRKSVESLREIWVIGNEYLAAQEPWKVIKTDKTRAATILNVAVNLIPFYARLMAPVIPFTASTLMHAFHSDVISGTQNLSARPHTPHPLNTQSPTLNTAWCWPTEVKKSLREIPAGAPFLIPSVLFTKIPDEQVQEWESRFGNQKA